MSINKLMCVFLLICACGAKTDKSSMVQRDSGLNRGMIEDEIQSKYLSASGMLVSRAADGGEADQGDSALFTGIAMGVTSCDFSTRFVTAFNAMVGMFDGHIVRFLPLPDEYAQNAISFDGESGWLFGIAARIKYCGSSDATSLLFKTRYARLLADGGEFFPGRMKYDGVVDGFEFSWRLVAHALGITGEPHHDLKSALETAVLTWTTGVVFKKPGCFRTHLAVLHMLILDMLGDPVSGNTHKLFCSVTRKIGNAAADMFCGRIDKADWLTHHDFKYLYEPQRCSAWETENPDGKTMARLDWLLVDKIMED